MSMCLLIPSLDRIEAVAGAIPQGTCLNKVCMPLLPSNVALFMLLCIHYTRYDSLISMLPELITQKRLFLAAARLVQACHLTTAWSLCKGCYDWLFLKNGLDKSVELSQCISAEVAIFSSCKACASMSIDHSLVSLKGMF